jgi:hypothetical protein
VPRTRRVLGLVRGLAPIVVFALVSGGVQIVGERSATAEEKIEYADGPTACRAFHAKNERELAEWSKTQPATPYQYPKDDEIIGAPWGPVVSGVGATGDLLLASLVPHVGSQLRADAPVVMIAWPWSVPIGPAYTCSRHQGSFTVRDYRYHRALVEPIVIAGQRGGGFLTRFGYRFLYHPSDWVVGAGGGVGTTIDLAVRGEPARASLSPEAVLQFGHCCDASYFVLAVRYDRYFAGNTANVIGGSLGYTFF